MKAESLANFNDHLDQETQTQEDAGFDANWRVVTIDFSRLYNLADSNYYRLLALQIIPQIAKIGEIKQPLNIPVPSTASDSFRFIRQLLRLNLGRITFLLKNTHLLSPERSREITNCIKKMSENPEYFAYWDSVQVIWQDEQPPKRIPNGSAS